MKRNDWILILIVLVISAAFYVGYNYYSGTGETVVITVNGIEYGEYSLDKDQTISINGENTVEIKNGHAVMVSATCPDGLCMDQGEIEKNHESIICLPNKVVVEVVSSEESEYDVIAR